MAVLAPTVDGENVIVKVALFPAGIGLAGVRLPSENCEAFAPLRLRLDILSGKYLN